MLTGNDKRDPNTVSSGDISSSSKNQTLLKSITDFINSLDEGVVDNFLLSQGSVANLLTTSLVMHEKLTRSHGIIAF